MKTTHITRASTFAIALSLQLAGCASEEAFDETEVESSSAALANRDLDLSGDAPLIRGGAKPAPVIKTPVSTPTTPIQVASTVGFEPQSNHPWVVDITGTGGLNCRGVLIHPLWVLTAAHCIGPYAGTVSYSRTDPVTGAVVSGSRPMNVSGPQRGMFKHPNYVFDSGFGQPQNDIALIRLAAPFEIDRNIQTAALPNFYANPGRTGAIVTRNHGSTPPLGSVSVLRSAQVGPSECTTPNGFLCLRPPAGSLCEGDSGSGFVQVLDGRAQVVGIASNISSNGTNCIPAGGEAQMADVYAYRGWILNTMGMGMDEVRGRVRLRWAGFSSTSIMSLQCLSAEMPAIEVPMNVPGGEIAMNCDDARVFCQAQGANMSLSGFSVRTFANGSVSTQNLTFTSGWTAAFADPGTSFLEYTCAVSRFGLTLPTTTTGGGVLATVP